MELERIGGVGASVGGSWGLYWGRGGSVGPVGVVGPMEGPLWGSGGGRCSVEL